MGYMLMIIYRQWQNRYAVSDLPQGCQTVVVVDAAPLS
jgi:hypothetical protein